MTYQPPEQPQPLTGPLVGAPTASPQGDSRTRVWALICAVAVLVLCMGGGVALALSAKRYGQQADQRKLATPTLRPSRDASTVEVPTSPTPSPTQPDPQIVKLGRMVTVTTKDGDVLEIVVKGKKTRRAGCEQFAPKPNRGLYVLSEVTITVVKGKANIAPYFFTWLTPNNTTSDNDSYTADACGTSLDRVDDLKAGNRRSGLLVFDVKAAKGHITYKLDGVVVGMWKVA